MNFFTQIIKAYKSVHLMVRIVIGLIIGTVLALIVPDVTVVQIMGELFVRSLKAIAPVLVCVLVASSISQAGSGIGKRFTTVICLYVASMLIAAVVSVSASLMFPITLEFPATDASTTEAAPAALGELFLNIVRQVTVNPFVAVSNAQYLSLLFWAIIVGLAMKFTSANKAIDVVQDFAKSISLVAQWVIQFAPFGVMGLVYTSVSTSGMDIFVTYGKLIALLVVCMLIQQMVCSPLLMGVLLRKNTYPLVWKCIKGSAVSAFFTRSSAANIPVNMTLCKRMKLDESFYSVSIPLGSTINMDGATITITIMTLATCHTMGIDVSFVNAIVLSILATIGACGASGIPGGSLLLIPMACSLFNIPQDVSMQVVGIGFIIGVVQDSFETALNSCGDVMYTAAAEFYDRKKSGQPVNMKEI